jgi:hypothetical protein
MISDHILLTHTLQCQFPSQSSSHEEIAEQLHRRKSHQE